MKPFSNSAIFKVITLGDQILVGLLIVVGVLSLVALNHLRAPGARVLIEVDGKVVHQADLSANQEFTVNGAIGRTVVHVHQGSARVRYSDCPDKVCVKTGKIQRAGEMIVCVPNKVVVKIEGARETSFDVITQ